MVMTREVRFTVRVLAVWVALSAAGTVLGQSISSVTTSPAFPSTSDIVVATVTGEQGSTDLFVQSWIVDPTPSSVTLGLYWASAGTGLPVVLPWYADYPLGTFSPGSYSLTVTSFYGFQQVDQKTAEFNVTPEPATLLLLAAGGVMTVQRRRRAL
jgi:hypothetical protein